MRLKHHLLLKPLTAPRILMLFFGAVISGTVLDIGTSRAASFDLSRDFSPNNNPEGDWSYGAKPSLDGTFSPFTVHGTIFDTHGLPVKYWQLVAGQEPTIYHNGTTNTEGEGSLTLPPGTVWLFSGANETSNGFGVVRFTVPADGDGVYELQSAVQPVYDGAPQGDTDFHVVKNGVELFGKFLAVTDRSSYSNMLALAAGDTEEFLNGRGPDNKAYGS